MKTKKLKTTLAIAAGVCCVAAIGLAAGNINANAATATDLTMVSGASVRLSSVDGSGIRFAAKVTGYDKSAATKYGMLVVPYDLVKGYEDGVDYIAELEKAYPNAADKLAWEYCTPYQAGKTIEDLNDTEGYYIVASIVKLLDGNYDTDYVGLAFSEKDGVKSFVSLAETNKRDIATVASAAYEDVVAEGVYVNEINAIIDKSLNAYGITQTQGFAPEFASTDYKLVTSDDVSIAETNGLPVVYTTNNAKVAEVKDGKLAIAGEGEATITASFGKYTQTISVAVSDAKTLKVDTTSATLLTPKTVDGTTNGDKTTATVEATYTYEIKGGAGTEATDVTWQSADPSVVTVDGGVITAVGSGSTTVTVSGEGYANSIEIPVTVYVPIKTAYDMDALSLITYNNDEATATKLMGGNYILMNDIDYSTHVRNFVLPIASPAGATTTTNAAQADFDLHRIAYSVMHNVFAGSSTGATQVVGIYAHFSKSWSQILNLEIVADTTNGSYMKKSDGSKFQGINPNLVSFTGVLDGNGYSIKNAWLMADNYLATDSWAHFIQSGTGACFMGLNSGTIRNLVFDNLTIPSGGTYVNCTKADGLKSEIKCYHSESLTGGGTNGNGTLAADYHSQWGEFKQAYASLLAANNVVYTLWTSSYNHNNGRYSDFSAMILLNAGLVENVKLVYTNTANAGYNGNQSSAPNIYSPRSLADGLVLYNNQNGTIKNVIVQRTDPINPTNVSGTAVNYANAKGGLTNAYYLTAMMNFGKIENTAVSNQMASTALKDTSGNAAIYREPIDVLGTKGTHDVTVYTDTAMTESNYVTLAKVI